MTYCPHTYAEWRRIKSATSHRKYLERLQEADDASADAWLAAVRRDEATDPYARHARRRKGRAIEREPRSADVCLKRWESATGRAAVLLASGGAGSNTLMVDGNPHGS